MKKLRFAGIIALAAVIGFAMAGCDNDPKPAHVHQWGEWEVTPANCTTAGSQTRTCTLDATHTETEAIPINDDHDWGEWEGTVTCTTAGTGTRTCSRSPTTHIETDNNLQPLGHAYNDEDWEETEPPTCSQKGKEEANCVRYAECGNTGTREIAIDPDAHDYQISSGTAPTCTEDGNGVEICSYNQEHILSGVLPKLGHDYQTYTETTPPTCSAAGKEEAPCTRDSNHEKGIRDIPIDSNAHDWNTAYTTITAATATTNGTEAITCTHNSSHTKESRTQYATGTAGLSFTAISNTAYRVSRGTATGAIHIPAYYRPDASSPYLPVTSISNGTDSVDNNAFGGTLSDPNTTVTSITFAAESQLTTISNYAFFCCSALTSITLPASVTFIGDSAFNRCASLASITIPAGVTSIGTGAFLSCTDLVSITLPASVTSIGNNMFNGCTGLVSITLPASVTSIGIYAFQECSSLASVIFAEGSQLQTIGTRAFYHCSSLTSINIPASVTSIGEDAFAMDYTNPNNLATVTFAEGSQLQTIGVRAFQNCKSLTNITIPANVTTIGQHAFSNCASFTSITIPASVTSIAGGVFANCSNLVSVTFAGPIASTSFGDNYYAVFPGDLDEKFYASNSANGKPGTYTTSNPGYTAIWTLQP